MDLNDLPLFTPAAKPPTEKARPKALSVSELTSQIKGTLEPTFSQVWVHGEISNYRPASSGHVYFSLKDSNSCISAAVFSWGSRSRTFELKDGLQVVCRGKVSVYAPRGSYQLLVDTVEPLGAGALQIAFEQLKAKLMAEGLFDMKRKRGLPKFPSRLAIVTSPTGAAIRDILNILNRRAPHVAVTIIPAIVQGAEAPAQVARGVQIANSQNLGDIIIVTRGGGSMEDLWGFNDETLARAIAASEIPVVSAVGHEIDFTISDFVADLRAPTPSAAAEIVTGHWVESIRILRESEVRLHQATLRNLAQRKTLLSHIAARLINPRDKLREQAQKCDELSLRLERAIQVGLKQKRVVLENLANKLDAMSPLRVLKRGYSFVLSKPEGVVVKSVAQVQKGQELTIKFHDGQTNVRAE